MNATTEMADGSWLSLAVRACLKSVKDETSIQLMDEGITDSAIRRLIVNMGDILDDLLILGRSDITTGHPQKKVKYLGNYDRLEKHVAEVIEKDKMRAFQSPVRGEEIMK